MFFTAQVGDVPSRSKPEEGLGPGLERWRAERVRLRGAEREPDSGRMFVRKRDFPGCPR